MTVLDPHVERAFEPAPAREGRRGRVWRNRLFKAAMLFSLLVAFDINPTVRDAVQVEEAPGAPAIAAPICTVDEDGFDGHHVTCSVVGEG